MKLRGLLLILLVAALAAAYFGFGLSRYLSLDYLHASREALLAQREAHPLAFVATFLAIYVAVTAASLPGAAAMTLAAGALFGLGVGTLVVSFASAIGATLAFLVARFLLRDAVQRRLGSRIEAIDGGLAKDGAGGEIFYLLTLRLVPLFPFFLVNLAMGLTAIRTRTFYWVSQVGMLAGTLVFVNAGTQLARIQTLRDAASPAVLGSLALLGVFPLVAKFLLAHVRGRKLYARWKKPKSFDRNLIVIGAGSAGLVSAYIAAFAKAKVTLVEAERMGGDCLNTGCVPSKSLIRTAQFLHDVRHAASLGVREASTTVEFSDVMARIKRIVAAIAPHDSIARYTKLGVEVLQGRATIVSPWSVRIESAANTATLTTTLTTRAIIIAAGAAPYVPPIPGLAEAGALTSETIWSLAELPRRLVVLGGGPIGCELAQAFVRLGSIVTLVEEKRLLVREDEDAAAEVARALAADGVNVMTRCKAVRVEAANASDAGTLVVDASGKEQCIAFDFVLVALGRAPRTKGYGLEELGIPLAEDNTIATDANLQTLYPNIYACGDVAGPYQFTHTAAHQAWTASVNALLGGWWRFPADYSVVPWATFTDPEVAHVGLNEQEAHEKKVDYEVTRYDLADLDRAIADETARGFVKVLTVPGRDRILGVTIVGAHAADLLAQYVLAMRHGIGLNGILKTIHTYPTLSEADKYAAAAWKRAHAPLRLLAFSERFFAWRRGP